MPSQYPLTPRSPCGPGNMVKRTRVSEHSALLSLDDNVLIEIFEYSDVKERVRALMACPRLYQNKALWGFEHLEFERVTSASCFIHSHADKVLPQVRSLTIGVRPAFNMRYHSFFGYQFPRLVRLNVCAYALEFEMGKGVLMNMPALEHFEIDFGNAVWNKKMKQSFLRVVLKSLIERERMGNPKLKMFKVIDVPYHSMHPDTLRLLDLVV